MKSQEIKAKYLWRPFRPLLGSHEPKPANHSRVDGWSLPPTQAPGPLSWQEAGLLFGCHLLVEMPPSTWPRTARKARRRHDATSSSTGTLGPATQDFLSFPLASFAAWCSGGYRAVIWHITKRRIKNHRADVAIGFTCDSGWEVFLNLEWWETGEREEPSILYFRAGERGSEEGAPST